MKTPNLSKLSRRERQIMHVVYRLGAGTAARVREEVDDTLSYSAVRAHLASLERKGHITHSVDGPRYIYAPTVAPRAAQKTALADMVRSFFQGSPARAAVALLEMSALEDGELAELEGLIRRAREEGR